ncbi:MAG: TonB family protein [Raineya sp.]|jgi:protein TonB|nr:TonB family protein [Raineya sp.]
MELQSFCYSPHEGFEGRNQEYGAYVLRRKYSRIVTFVLIAVIISSSLIFSYPIIKRLIEKATEEKAANQPKEEEIIQEAILELPEEKELPQEKQQVVIEVPPPPQVDQTKFTEIEIKEEKVEKPLVENKEIEEKQTAIDKETKEGESSPNKPEEVVVVEKPKELEKAGTGEEENKTFQEFEVAQNAEYEGGINAFRKELQKKISYPSLAKRKETQGNVVLQFTVDKDGSITDIKVLRDIGDGCGDEAVKALKQMNTKWAPAKNAQGKPVRVRKSIPVAFKLDK